MTVVTATAPFRDGCVIYRSYCFFIKARALSVANMEQASAGRSQADGPYPTQLSPATRYTPAAAKTLPKTAVQPQHIQ